MNWVVVSPPKKWQLRMADSLLLPLLAKAHLSGRTTSDSVAHTQLPKLLNPTSLQSEFPTMPMPIHANEMTAIFWWPCFEGDSVPNKSGEMLRVKPSYSLFAGLDTNEFPYFTSCSKSFFIRCYIVISDESTPDEQDVGLARLGALIR